MIQRIQSIYLFLAVIALGLLFMSSLDFGRTAETIATNSILSDGDLDIQDHPILMGLVGVSGIILLVAIFLYSNRKVQSTVIKISVFLIVVLAGFAGFQTGSSQTIAENAGQQLQLSFGWFNPFIALVFTLLALRAVGKDEKLVKSMDRLR